MLQKRAGVQLIHEVFKCIKKKYRKNLKVSNKHLKCMCQVCVLHIEEASFDQEANGKNINRKGTLIKKRKG